MGFKIDWNTGKIKGICRIYTRDKLSDAGSILGDHKSIWDDLSVSGRRITRLSRITHLKYRFGFWYILGEQEWQWWERLLEYSIPACCPTWVEFFVVGSRPARRALSEYSGFDVLLLKKPTFPNSISTLVELVPHWNQLGLMWFSFYIM